VQVAIFEALIVRELCLALSELRRPAHLAKHLLLVGGDLANLHAAAEGVIVHDFIHLFFAHLRLVELRKCRILVLREVFARRLEVAAADQHPLASLADHNVGT